MLDLFGTLVTAPTPEERARAASRLAAVVGCDTGAVKPDQWLYGRICDDRSA